MFTPPDDPMTATEETQYIEAVQVANIPTLLMVLVQLTGEMHWLEDPYRPRRQPGMGDNDTGGLRPEHQTEVREAALEAMLSWRNGRPVAIADPEPELLVKMLHVAMDEEIPDIYGPFTKSQLGQQPIATNPIDVPEGFSAIVIGAGVSGLCAAVHLQAANIPFTVLERNDDIGGVWLENTYPGAGVDTPNHLYSFSFMQYDWPEFFALQDELWGYLKHVAETFGLRPKIELATTVERAEYRETEQDWEVTVRRADGSVEVQHATIVISGAGIFNPPVIPNIDGLESFEGPSFHTSRWRDDVELEGKRVAIIGNGASCMQIAPLIKDQVESLTIFQRSNHWAAPFEQFRRPVPEALRFLLRENPIYQAWYRVRLGWTFNDRNHSALQKDPTWEHSERSLNAANDGHRGFFERYIRDELGDRQDLFDVVVPKYPPFGKRMLMDNGWYRMLRNENVTLVTDSITSVDATSVTTDTNDVFEADVIIIATGFDVLRFINTYETIGRGGQSLRDAWQDDNAKAYLGTTVPDFPNFFTLYGPNLQPGHGGSLINVIEMQMHYIIDLIEQMAADDLGSVDILPEVHATYNDQVDAAHENMVWTHPGMSTYYRNDRGRIVVNSPYRNVDFYEWTRHADLDEYLVEPRALQT